MGPLIISGFTSGNLVVIWFGILLLCVAASIDSFVLGSQATRQRNCLIGQARLSFFVKNICSQIVVLLIIPLDWRELSHRLVI